MSHRGVRRGGASGGRSRDPPRDAVPAGVIFGCNNTTMMECMQRSLFGLPGNQSNLVSRIAPGTTLFLFNFETKNLHGIFEATSYGGLNQDPSAFKAHSSAGFPAQVWVQLRHDCTPIHESVFKEAIRDNYYSSTKFNFELNLEQVSRLLHIYSLTQPVSASRQPHSSPQYEQQGVPPGTENYTTSPPTYETASTAYSHPSQAPYANAPPAYIIVHPEPSSSGGYNASSTLPPQTSYYLNPQDGPPGYEQVQSQAADNGSWYQSGGYGSYSHDPYSTTWQSHPPYDPANPSI